MHVEVHADGTEQGKPDLLARRIVDEIGRVLARDRVLGRTGRGGDWMSGVLQKGALVSFSPTFVPFPVPNVIIFQYNPETMTHTWTQPEPAPPSATATGPAEGSNPLAVKGLPGESFSFTIAMDANEEIAEGSPPDGGARPGQRDLQQAGSAGDAALPGDRGAVRAAWRGVRGYLVRPQRPGIKRHLQPSRNQSCQSPFSSGGPGASCPSG